MQLQKATRKKSKLRLNISGPAGSGKTYSALLMAKGLVGNWDKIAVIDTENGSASLYDHLGDFQSLDLQQPFSPERYAEAIDICIKAGIECIIIDSTTHEWNGPGGCIDINERLAQSKFKGNTWSAWSQTTPRHDAFVQKVLQCPVHVITCTRSKMETVMTDDKKVKKLGMKDLQREGWEYELTVSLNIDRDTHTATASKDRTELFEGMDPFIITEATGATIRDWCEKGIEVDHKPIQATTTPTKLALADKAFTDGLNRIKNGEHRLVQMMKDTFTLSPEQVLELDAAMVPTEVTTAQ
ncbi:MAG: AAA family ATPase [Bacteroidota bacterium]